MKNHPLPDGVSLRRMIEAQGFCRYHGFESAEAAAYCRETGLTLDDIKAFDERMTEDEDDLELVVVNPEEVAETRAQLREVTRELRDARKELKRTDKALAEAQALLKLSKKVQALRGIKNN